jgi:hypothetical protein
LLAQELSWRPVGRLAMDRERLHVARHPVRVMEE